MQRCDPDFEPIEKGMAENLWGHYVLYADVKKICAEILRIAGLGNLSEVQKYVKKI